MKKAIDRFWSWLFHPSIMRQNYQEWKGAIPRYPSPDNLRNVQDIQDFREPYATSRYNIRYAHLTPAQLEEFGSFYVGDRAAGYRNW